VTHERAKEEYYAKIKWSLIIRTISVTILLGTLIFFQRQYQIYSFPTRYLYYFILFIYVLTGVYWYVLRKVNNLALFAHIQIAGDIGLVTLLVRLTGGIDSSFSILYHVTIISASIMTYRRGGYLAASLSSILFGAMLDLQYYNAAGFVRSQNYTAMQVLYLVFINILSFYAVALLSGYLADRLYKTRQELREKSSDLSDLRTLQEHILKSIGSGILTVDFKGLITSWNPAAELITGYTHDEINIRLQDVFGSIISSLFGHTEDLKERPYRFEGSIFKKDGSTAILGIVASLLKDELNAVSGITLIFDDITKIVQMEDLVRRQERLASVGSLAAGIAHEIRNPLASLSGSIQVLQGELDLKGDNRNLMEIVVRETDRLNTIITEFLEYARPKTNKDDCIALPDLLSETCTLLRNSRDFVPGLKIESHVDGAIMIQGDARRLRQVFWNLLINASQAMPDGGKIQLSAMPFSHVENDSVWCEIVVADTGPGIGEENIEKIFDPFFTTKPGGTGLGLSIVHRIVEDHGGTVSVESTPGKGTTFRVRLPMMNEGAYAGLFTGESRSGQEGDLIHEQDPDCR
jgi:two-component system sensor histidine kinase PilS (NtrC family)